MKKIVLDIETCGVSMEELSSSQQEFLLRDIEEERASEIERTLSYYPFTSKVIAIGMMDLESGKSAVYYESEEDEQWDSGEDNIKFAGRTECDMLKLFWKIMARTELVITFNGRLFDIPFLMVRSAILKIKPVKNFVRNRFDKRHHIDLMDQLSFYGSIRKFNLDFYCHAFGVTSPKTKELNGREIKNYYKDGRIREIAQYCARDVKATYELFNIWNEYLNLE
ncbi:MAG: 3'-5' exonuclease [Ignavibacteria bacterium]|jgi:DNA polymerase elongation subunit (family B)|nr:3'-5' exonuclease [Ignavibacteria bacterium]MCU7504845.1 3'-5' exonuclease [Ignavibacteria bacterium]MCU7517731.1 3'-5' exonuclease [Ignavibacteria bacterium]